ncbi:MAG: hypothetical protein IJC06_01905 [Clostridia bacterium]|nr:hypothetical protein [Clostridia bacterium]
MFNSGISAKDLVAQLKNEVDVAIPISNASYVSWLNSLEQLLYTELIQEQGKIELDSVSSGVIGIDTLNVSNDENAVRFEDIHAVYADQTQLIESTVASGVIFPDTYYKIQNNIGLNLKNQAEKLKIIYFVRPALKTVDTNDNISSENVMLPVEFIDLAKAKLRGEAYKVANEDSIAAKWLNDYNVLLETFKAWISGKQSEFGM